MGARYTRTRAGDGAARPLTTSAPSATTPNKLHRREYKYLVDERQVDQIRRYIEGICSADEHAAAGGRYLIDTLYLDTPRHDIYWATVRDQNDRYKLRIRSYPSAKNAPIFFEVKRRVSDAVLKTRGSIRGNWQRILLDGTPEVLAEIAAPQRRAIDNFICHFHKLPMEPCVHIRYEREPYFSQIDHYARVTFDRSLSYQRAEQLTIDAPDSNWLYIDNPGVQRGVSLDHSLVLLELKFTSLVPGWMRHLSQTLGLQRLAFCKYTRAVEAMQTLPTFRIARSGVRG